MVVAEHLVSGAVGGARRRAAARHSAVIEGERISPRHRARPRRAARAAHRRDPALSRGSGRGAGATRYGNCHAARFSRRDVRPRALGRCRRAPGGTRSLPDVCARQGLGSADCARPSRAGSPRRRRSSGCRMERARACYVRTIPIGASGSAISAIFGQALAHSRRPHHQRGRADAVAARRDPRRAHDGPGRASRLRPQAAARARHRGRRTQSHVAVVAKAIGIAAVGQARGIVERVSAGDAAIIDALTGEVHLRPSADVVGAYSDKVRFLARRQRQYRALRTCPPSPRTARASSCT